MPNRNARIRRRESPSAVLPVMIVILCCFAAALIVILVRSDPLGTDKPTNRPATYPEELHFTEGKTAADVPLVLLAATAEPEPVDVVELVETPVEEEPDVPEETLPPADAPEEPEEPDDANPFMPKPKGEGFLPIVDRALRTKNDEMMIAVTVDDCNDPEALTEVVRLAQKYGAKLTLFPTGEVMMKAGMVKGLRTCVKVYGYEIENHTFGHKAEYRISDAEIALQIWKGGLAASYCMGADYQVHFFRPYNHLSVMDQRTHFMCEKLGYVGIAGYTCSYKDVENVDEMLKTLQNGNIYQFDMKSESMAMFEDFLRGANKKGYKMVTLNTLCGLEPNRIGSSLNLEKEELPSMSDYTTPLYDLYLGDRTHAVYRLQNRLRQLGYLITADSEGEPLKADGIYGSDTSAALSIFQGQAGLPATGNADVATQEALYAEDAPVREGYVRVE